MGEGKPFSSLGNVWLPAKPCHMHRPIVVICTITRVDRGRESIKLVVSFVEEWRYLYGGPFACASSAAWPGDSA